MSDQGSPGLEKGLRILVTGAEGFVGKHLLMALSRTLPGSQIHGCVHAMPADPSPEATFHTLDITDRQRVEQVIDAVRPSHIIHLAGISAVTHAGQSPDLAWQVNLFGTLNLADAVLRHCPAAHLIFASSAEVYGRVDHGEPISEDQVLAPANLYACTKAAADLTLGQKVSEGLSVIRMRPFNHTGPGQSEAFVVSAFAAQIARIEAGLQPPVIEVGNLVSERDFLDVRDVVAAYIKAALKADEIRSGVILNLASGVPRSIGSVLDQLRRMSTKEFDVVVDRSRLRASEVAVVLGDARRAMETLDWRPTHGWENTLDDVLSYWRMHQRVGQD